MAFTVGTEDLAISICLRVQELIRAVPEIEPAKVHFARAYEIQPDEMPCISVEVGPDQPTDPDGQQSSNFTDSELTVYVDLYDQQNDSEAMISVAFQRALCHRAIFQDETLGLPYVIQARYGGATEPASDEESGLPGWTMRVPFPVHYRFNFADRTVFNSG